MLSLIRFTPSSSAAKHGERPVPVSDATQFGWRDTDQDTVAGGQAFWCKPNLGNVLSVFLEIPYIMRARLLIDRRRSGKNNNIASVIVGLKIHRHVRLVGNILYLVRGRLTIDQEGLTIPIKPNGVWLRSTVRRYCGQPNNVIVAKPLLRSDA